MDIPDGLLTRDATHSEVLLIVDLSVCLFGVCHTRGLYPHGSTYEATIMIFFTRWQPHDSSFLAPNFVSTIRVGDGGRGHVPPPQKKKNRQNIFSGKNRVKFGNFVKTVWMLAWQLFRVMSL